MQLRKNTHRFVERTLTILLSFTRGNREKGIVELSKELGYHASNVSRLVQVLTNYGFLRNNPWTKKYSLGKSAFDLGRAIYQSVREQLVTIAKPYIDELSDFLGIDVGLEVLLDDGTILAYRAWGPRPFKVRYTIGDRIPVHVAAGAKAIMAFSPPEVMDNLLKGELIRFTPKTITNQNVLKKKLAEFRRRGVAFDLNVSIVVTLLSEAEFCFQERLGHFAGINMGSFPPIGRSFSARYFLLYCAPYPAYLPTAGRQAGAYGARSGQADLFRPLG